MKKKHYVMEPILTINKDAKSCNVFINNKHVVANLITAIKDQQLEIFILTDRIGALEKKVGI